MVTGCTLGKGNIKKLYSFDGLVCDACGEMVVEGYARLAGEQRVCIPCHEQLTGLREPRATS